MENVITEKKSARPVACKWYAFHKWMEWKDVASAKTVRGKPVVIQERRCVVCNKVQRHVCRFV